MTLISYGYQKSVFCDIIFKKGHYIESGINQTGYDHDFSSGHFSYP